jgi:hypothetical protein
VVGRSLAAGRKERWWLNVAGTAIVPVLAAALTGIGGLVGWLVRRKRRPG